jgi:hypothetical protein
MGNFRKRYNQISNSMQNLLWQINRFEINLLQIPSFGFNRFETIIWEGKKLKNHLISDY